MAAQNLYPYPELDNTETQISDIERTQPYAELGMPYSRPYVGIAVVCRCTSGQVFCILQRKGQNSFGSLKWSFPGGRLDLPRDTEENGSVGTKRKLTETCGGGTPHGLPPLIHIIWSQSGKNHHTLYHVFSIDPDADSKWDDWHPAPLPEFIHEVDTSAQDLIIDRDKFECKAGNCWVDLECLGRECYQLDTNPLARPDLHRGLINWVQMYAKQTFSHLNINTQLPDPRPQRSMYARRRHSSLPLTHYIHNQPIDTSQLSQNYQDTLSQISRMPVLPHDISSQPLYPMTVPLPTFMTPGSQSLHRSSSGAAGSMSPQQFHFNPISPAISPTMANPSPSVPTSPSTSISSGSSICFPVPPPQYKPHDRATDSPKSFISEPPFPTERPSTADSLESASSADDRKNMPCQYFLAGHCHYGDNCWFYHPSQPTPPPYLDRDNRAPMLSPAYPQYPRGRFYLPTAMHSPNVPSYPQLFPHLPYFYSGHIPSHPMAPPMFSSYNKYHRHYKPRSMNPYTKCIQEEKLRHCFSIVGFTGCFKQIFLLGNNTVLIYDFCYPQNMNRITLSYQGEENFATAKLCCLQGSAKHFGLILLGCEDGSLIVWNWIAKQYVQADPTKASPISCLALLSTNSVLAGTMDGGILLYHFSFGDQQDSIHFISGNSSHPNKINDIHCTESQAVSVDISGNIFVWKLEETETSFLFKLSSNGIILQSHFFQSYLLTLSYPNSSTHEGAEETTWPMSQIQPSQIHTSTIHEEVMSADLEQLTLDSGRRSNVELWDLSTTENKPCLNKYLENEFTSSAICETPNCNYLAISSVQGEIFIIDCYSFNVLMSFPVLPQTSSNIKCLGIHSQCTPRQENQVFNINLLTVWSDGVIRIHNCRLWL